MRAQGVGSAAGSRLPGQTGARIRKRAVIVLLVRLFSLAVASSAGVATRPERAGVAPMVRTISRILRAGVIGQGDRRAGARDSHHL